MNSAARAVMQEYTDICIAYGVSDEYSFVLQPKTDLYSRRARSEAEGGT
jgi:tRNA(His) guanylyltransferase